MTCPACQQDPGRGRAAAGAGQRGAKHWFGPGSASSLAASCWLAWPLLSPGICGISRHGAVISNHNNQPPAEESPAN